MLESLEVMEGKDVGGIEWDDFLGFIHDIEQEQRRAQRQAQKEDSLFKVQTGQGEAETPFLAEEVSSFTRLINKELADVEELKDRLPIDPGKGSDLFNALSDGIIVIYLLNRIKPGRIDMKLVNLR